MNTSGERLDIIRMVGEIDLTVTRHPKQEDEMRIKLASYAFALRTVLTEKPRALGTLNGLHDRERQLKGLIPAEIITIIARKVVRDWLEHDKT